MTKKRLEQIVAAVESSCNSQAWPQKIAPESTSSTKTKPIPKLKAKESSITKGKIMQQLEALHERTGVKENLQLGDGSRIKLEHDLRGTAKRVMPIFDLEFASLSDEPSKPALDDSALPSESDDDMPDACYILGTLGSSEGEKPIAASDSTDYADPEFDALIANVPIDWSPSNTALRTPRKRTRANEVYPRDTKRARVGSPNEVTNLLLSRML